MAHLEMHEVERGLKLHDPGNDDEEADKETDELCKVIGPDQEIQGDKYDDQADGKAVILDADIAFLAEIQGDHADPDDEHTDGQDLSYGNEGKAGLCDEENTQKPIKNGGKNFLFQGRFQKIHIRSSFFRYDSRKWDELSIRPFTQTA